MPHSSRLFGYAVLKREWRKTRIETEVQVRSVRTNKIQFNTDDGFEWIDSQTLAARYHSRSRARQQCQEIHSVWFSFNKREREKRERRKHVVWVRAIHFVCPALGEYIPLSHPIIIFMAVINLLRSCRLTAQWWSSVRTICLGETHTKCILFSVRISRLFMGCSLFAQSPKEVACLRSTRIPIRIHFQRDSLFGRDYNHGRYGSTQHTHTHTHDLSVPPKTCIRISYSVHFFFVFFSVAL